MDGIERLPYRLPAMLASDYVIVVEGEKDVDRLADAGLVATTKSGGARSSWEPSALRWFRDKDVFVIPDNDDVGRRGAEKTCAALEGIARSVVLAPVCDGMPAKSDVSDWLDADKGDLLAAVRAFPSSMRRSWTQVLFTTRWTPMRLRRFSVPMTLLRAC